MRNPFSKPRKNQTSQSSDSQPITPPDFAIQPMTNQRLDGLIRQISPKVSGELGYWKVTVDGRDILIITDAAHNRMRIMSPVAMRDKLDAGELARLLEANFGSALDAKYALREDTLWSVFTHPLAELSEEQFLDCAAQVANLANNFGSSYASSNLIFGGG